MNAHTVWGVITSAPVSFIVAVVGAALLIWVFAGYFHREKIHAKDAALAIKDATIEALQQLVREKELQGLDKPWSDCG